MPFAFFTLMLLGLLLLIGLAALIAYPRTRGFGLIVGGVFIGLPCIALIVSLGYAAIVDVRGESDELPAIAELLHRVSGGAVYSAPTPPDSAAPPPVAAMTTVHPGVALTWAPLLVITLIVGALAAASWRCFDRRRYPAGWITGGLAALILVGGGGRVISMNQMADRTESMTATVVIANPPIDNPPTVDEAFDRLTEPRIALDPPPPHDPPPPIDPPPANDPPPPIDPPPNYSVAEIVPNGVATRALPVDSERNLILVGIAACSVLGLVATAYGFLRIDDATGRRYTLLLLMGMPVGIMVLLTAIYYLAPGDWLL